MAADSRGELELGHVLCTDIVGYSKLSIEQQKQLLADLTAIARATEQFRRAEAHGKLIRLPTGDGMVLVFFTSPQAPVECALEVAAALKANGRIPLRMGIHSGPVEQVRDVNDSSNIAGAGINMAQRVMDCGDAGHILLSQRVAEDLAHYDRWRPHLIDLGDVTVKHGVNVHVFNLHLDGLGNGATPAKIQKQREEQAVAGKKARSRTLRKSGLVAGGVVAVLIAAAAYFGLTRFAPQLRHAASALSEKTIAVLPFDSFTEDKENAYFTDGMQDEILTDLSKIADLKVISRSSVMQYRGVARNLKEIGKALQVAYVLEGSVQKVGNRIRINTQLIDTRTDAHVWAEKFDRDLSDIFAIQSELAEKIVNQLRLSLTPREKAAISDRTTTNAQAYDLYLKSKEPKQRALGYNFPKEEYLAAEQFINQALTLDPNFAIGYCQLMDLEIHMYWLHDHDPARKRKAEEALQTAMRLRPDVGEVRLAQGTFLYQNDDFDQARAAFEVAGRMLPNNGEVHQAMAKIDRRRGQWNEALGELQKASEVDPHNPEVYEDLAATYAGLRQYSEALRIVARALGAFPDNAVRFKLAQLSFAFSAGDTQQCRALLDSVPAGFNPNGVVSYWRFQVAYLDRDWAEAKRIVDVSAGLPPQGYTVPFAFLYGQIARGQRDNEKAKEQFAAARQSLQEIAAKRPDDIEVQINSALCDAALGRADDAVAEAKAVVAKRPISQDEGAGVYAVVSLAKVYAWAGKKDQAIEQLASVIMMPDAIDTGELQKNADWDDLRGDPRFEKLVERVVAATK